MLNVHKIVNGIFNSNSYLLENEEYDFAWLIDIGDVEPVMKLLDKEDKKLKGIFLTHSHFDHIYGLNLLLKEFPHLVVYTSLHGKEGLLSDKLNLSRYHESSSFILDNSQNVICLRERDEVELWPDISLVAIETPGHDWSCLTYIIEDSLFTGDSFIPQFSIMKTFPKSNLEQAIYSTNCIIDLMKKCKFVYPGHGDSISY